jgi:uncharacterized protein
MNVAFPISFSALGRTALVDGDRHVRDLIELALFTAPGERVNRPDFGAGVGRLLFEPSGDTLAGATQTAVHSSLQQAVGDRAAIESVTVRAEGERLVILVQYRVLLTGARSVARFEGVAP